MKQRVLGDGGPRIPLLGLGTWPIGGGMGGIDNRTAIATVRSAIDCGITLLDTAQAYRTSETILGEALSDGYRAKCFLSTKVSGDYSPEGIRSAVENSLSALRVDYIDLYQIHGWDPRYPVDASMETLHRLRDEGKTRFIGVSNYNADQMRAATENGRFQSNQVAYNLLDRRIEGDDIAYCESEGIGILVHSPLAKGLLTGRYQPGHRFAADDERSVIPRFQNQRFASSLAVAERLKEIAADLGITLVQLAVAWALLPRPVSCVLVGAKHPDQVAEHLRAADVELDANAFGRIAGVLADDSAE